jgi:ParB-like chromosome segregation protein Spo0J
MSDDAARVLSLAENLHRLELNHADAAQAVTTLYKHFHKDVHRLSKETGLSVTRINRYLKIKERASKETLELLGKKKVRDFDVSRALDWAGDDQAKADRMVKAMAELTPRERRNLVEIAREKPKASIEEMEHEARKPRIRQKLSVDLTEALWQGIEKAKQSLAMEAEEIAALAIEKWLRTEGFVS